MRKNVMNDLSVDFLGHARSFVKNGGKIQRSENDRTLPRNVTSFEIFLEIAFKSYRTIKEVIQVIISATMKRSILF